MAVWGGAAFVAALGGTSLARGYALGRGMVDEPGARRSHAVATPRGGGIAIVFVLLVALLAIAQRPDGQPWFAYAVFAGLLLVAGVGWCDDHRPLPASLRLLAHVVAAAFLAWVMLLHGAGWMAAAIAGIAALVLVNVWNFMDGIDGLAASQCALVAAAYSAWLPGPMTPWLAVALAAGACGFLPFNFPRARIFLGDVGSGAIGFALAAVLASALLSFQPGPVPQPGPVGVDVRMLAWLLPLSAFTVDASLTLGRRMVRREAWWTAHVTHAYQRAARGAGGHVATTAGYACWTMASICLMAWVQPRGAAAIMAATVAWHALATGIWLWLQRPIPQGPEA